MTSILKVSTIQNTAGTAPTAADLGLNVTGTVLQCVHTSTATSQSSTSTSFVDMTNMSLSITPSATNSLIFISASLSFAAQRSGTVNIHGTTQLLRGSTVISGKDLRAYDYGAGGIYINAELGYSLVDQPATTSAVTYKFQMKKSASDTNGVQMNAEVGNRSSIVIMEIAG